jgi:hypothetical protein
MRGLSERIKYAIRLPANQVLQSRIGYLLTRPVGRPPHHVRRFHANFSYQARTWTKPRRVIAKVEARRRDYQVVIQDRDRSYRSLSLRRISSAAFYCR